MLKRILILSISLFSLLALNIDAQAQAKIKKSKLSKGEKEALKDFERRQAGKETDEKEKDDSFLAQWKDKRAKKKDPSGMKLGLKHSMGKQDKATRKRMKKHYRKSKNGKWKK